MKLTELEPKWVNLGRDELGYPPPRRGIGITFRCPHCIGRLYVPFANPIDGGPPQPNSKGCAWQRTGDTFESMSLTPSVDASEGGCWHGFITNGEVT